MELQQLQHFLALARLGNIGRAADELHITHSGLSRSIKTLEEFLGLQLFVRQSRGVSITPFGEALLPRATRILNERARAIAELEALRALRAGHVVTALHPAFDDTIAAEVLGHFADRFPEVEVDLWSGADPELTERLIGGDFDFAFTLFGTRRDEHSLVYEQLLRLPIATYARAGHPLAGIAVDEAAIQRAEWVLLGASAFRRAFYDHFRHHGFDPPRRVLQSSSMALLRLMVARRDCLTLLPCLIGDQADSGLMRLDAPIEGGTLEAGLLYRRASFHSVSGHSLMEAFRASARGLAPD